MKRRGGRSGHGTHPEVPAVVLLLGAGSVRAPAGTLRLGHFAAMRWHGSDIEGPVISSLSDSTG
ncbi:MAG: hypothetical protein ACRDRK_12125 [Pseudonocardia sp.]